MGEFLFKNLSVKLLPDEAADEPEACVDRTTSIECGPNHTCFELLSTPTRPACGFCTVCTFQTCGHPLTLDILITRDARSELAAHKTRLRAALADVEHREQALIERGKPKTLEEVDRLRAILLEAVAELDEHRARLESGGDPGPE